MALAILIQLLCLVELSNTRSINEFVKEIYLFEKKIEDIIIGQTTITIRLHKIIHIIHAYY